MFERHLETNEYLRIPVSGNKYSININGQIKNSDETLVKTTFDSNGDLVAWMYLWNGWNNYKVAILIAHVFKPTFIPFMHWDKLTVLFLDGDKRNIHPSNLVWKFPIGLESNKYPGYAFIPCFSKYVINKEGVLLNYKTGKEIVFSIVKKGYRRTSVMTDLNSPFTIGRHRLLCLAWLDYPVNVDAMHVNHINGIPGNDDINNLEWITPKGNVYHALRAGLRIDGKEVLVRNVKTGIITSYYTEEDARKALGFRKGAIRMVTNMPLAKRKHYKGYDIRLAREGELWDDLDTNKHADVLESATGKSGKEDPFALGLRDDSIKVTTRNVKTGIINEYYSLSACARALAISVSAVKARLDNNKNIIYNGYIQLKYTDDLEDWSEVTDNDLTKYATLIDPSILIRNVKTGIVTKYDTIALCGKAIGIKCDTLYRYLYDFDQRLLPGYFQIKKDDASAWRDPIDIDKEHNEAIHGIAVLSRHIDSGKITEYVSARQCAIELGLSEMTIAMRLRDKLQKVYPGNLQFKRKFDNTPWREVIDASNELKNRNYPKLVYVRDVFTNKEYSFTSIVEASTTLGIPTNALRINKYNRPYKKYEVKFDDTPWPNHSAEDLKMFELAISENTPFKGRGFRLTDVVTGEEKLYISRKKLAEDFNISIHYVSELAIDNLIYKNKWRFSYY